MHPLCETECDLCASAWVMRALVAITERGNRVNNFDPLKKSFKGWLINLYFAMMTPLNLPSIEPNLKKDQGRVLIFDRIRKKYVVLTPEEWVRQHFIQHLIENLKYPKSLFRIESSLTYNKVQKRSDILVHDRVGKPWMLIECKSSSIKLTQKAFNQIAVYNMTVGAAYLAVTNGMIHYCWKAPRPGGEAVFLDSFPRFE